MTDIDLTPEAIQTHLENGARMRSEAVQNAFAGMGSAVAGVLRSAAGALAGDWLTRRAA